MADGLAAAKTAKSDVLVVGGGLIGLAIAWRTAQGGRTVTVVDPHPGRGPNGRSAASWAAAGMLAPVSEVHYGEEHVLALNVASNRLWPQFAAELADASGLNPGFRPSGTITVAFNADDKSALDHLRSYQERLGLQVTSLTSRECKKLEPMLSPHIHGGVLMEGDHSVDNRATHAALMEACRRAGVRFVALPAGEYRTTPVGSRVTGVEVRHDNGLIDVLDAEVVVAACGTWTSVAPVRPVRGEVLRLAAPPSLRAAGPLLRHVIRATVVGWPVYVVPRDSGELVLGATATETGFDPEIQAGGLYSLLRDARRVLPIVDELQVADITVGFRPGSPDNAPLLGPTDIDGLVLATGHFRHGVLLTPLTAAAVSNYLLTGERDRTLELCDPNRFSNGGVSPPTAKSSVHQSDVHQSDMHQSEESR